MTFAQCVTESFKNEELVSEFDRLTGSNLSLKGSPLDLLIDESCDRFRDEARSFIFFVYDAVWSRLPTGGEEGS